MLKAISLILLTAASSIVAINVYLFSRVTVDDAFIAWRYGRNLIDSGIWGYNPTPFDLTQAYTSPLYAALSIIPAALAIDFVVFFKIISSLSVGLTIVIFYCVSKKKPWATFLALAFLATPATVVHAFAGLETFTYVAAMGALFILLTQRDALGATLVTSLLILTRPEAWLLIALVPGYLAYSPLKHWKDDGLRSLKSAFRSRELRPALYALIVLFGIFSSYSIFHYGHFGHILPNTFYAKADSGFDPFGLARLVFFASPALVLLVLRRSDMLMFIGLFYAPIIFSYSTSDLQMDYMERFTYHLFAPLFILLAHIAASDTRDLHIVESRDFSKPIDIGYSTPIGCVAVFYLAAFFLISTDSPSLLHIANYYPRALESQAALGKAIDKVKAEHDIGCFSLGDAGMAAFHSRTMALDNIGLGSSLVAHEGMKIHVIQQYSPDLVVFHARPEGIRVNDYGQAELLEWATRADYEFICDVYWKPDYVNRIYSAIEDSRIDAVCARSKEENDMSDREFFSKHAWSAPWGFWRE